jgi:hypothetical protein
VVIFCPPVLLVLPFQADRHYNPQPSALPPARQRTRPTVLEAWAADATLTRFLNTLRAGNIAVSPEVFDADATPIRILLGDYLANAGVIFRDAATTRRGVRVEG